MTTTDDVLATVPEPAGADIRVEPVRYDHEGTALAGVLAKDRAASGHARRCSSSTTGTG
jgi:hypothetical protein